MPDEAPPVEQIDADQNREQLARITGEIATILTPNETILYVALQNITALSLKKDSAVATNNRLIIYRPSVLGRVNFADYLWEDVRNVTIKDGMLSAELHVELRSGKSDSVGGLDKSQIRRLYGIAQQKELEWREKHRQRELEEARAKAGGVQVGSSYPSQSSPPMPEDPVEKLAKAKAMLDQNLISEQEYESLKAKIIAAF